MQDLGPIDLTVLLSGNIKNYFQWGRRHSSLESQQTYAARSCKTLSVNSHIELIWILNFREEPSACQLSHWGCDWVVCTYSSIIVNDNNEWAPARHGTCKGLMTATLCELLLEIFMQRQRTYFCYISSWICGIILPIMMSKQGSGSLTYYFKNF